MLRSAIHLHPNKAECKYLMGTADQIQVVLVQELGYHLRAKGKRYTPVILPPAQNILVWVRPEQITQETLVRNISGAHDTSDLLHGLKVGWETCEEQRQEYE